MRPTQLKDYRKRLGLTQEEAGRSFGVSRVTIQNWERGTTPVPVSVDRLAELRERSWWQRQAQHGPVVLTYHTGPPDIVTAANTPNEPCETNEVAIRRACELRKLHPSHQLRFLSVTDMSGRNIWVGDEIEVEVTGRIAQERRNGQANRTGAPKSLAERLMEIGREFSSLPVGTDPNITAEDLYDEDGLPK